MKYKRIVFNSDNKYKISSGICYIPVKSQTELDIKDGDNLIFYIPYFRCKNKIVNIKNVTYTSSTSVRTLNNPFLPLKNYISFKFDGYDEIDWDYGEINLNIKISFRWFYIKIIKMFYDIRKKV